MPSGGEFQDAPEVNRLVDVPGEQRVTVLMTDDELASLDQLRGSRSRSEFIGDAVLTRRRVG